MHFIDEKISQLSEPTTKDDFRLRLMFPQEDEADPPMYTPRPGT